MLCDTPVLMSDYALSKQPASYYISRNGFKWPVCGRAGRPLSGAFFFDDFYKTGS
jgi:hypothetical protein